MNQRLMVARLINGGELRFHEHADHRLGAWNQILALQITEVNVDETALDLGIDHPLVPLLEGLEFWKQHPFGLPSHKVEMDGVAAGRTGHQRGKTSNTVPKG